MSKRTIGIWAVLAVAFVIVTYVAWPGGVSAHRTNTVTDPKVGWVTVVSDRDNPAAGEIHIRCEGGNMMYVASAPRNNALRGIAVVEDDRCK